MKNKNKTDTNRSKYKIAKKALETSINAEKTKYFHNSLVNTNNNIKQKWDAIRVMINRKKVDQNNCTIPNSTLGKHYATIANKLAEKLPKLTNDDIPSTSKLKYYTKPNAMFNFNNF